MTNNKGFGKRHLLTYLVASGLTLGACSYNKGTSEVDRPVASSTAKIALADEVAQLYEGRKQELHTIYLAGGCFWGVEEYFKHLPGVSSTKVGYANGKGENTNYEQIHYTDHAETLELVYNPHAISLQELLLHYFRIIDPLSVNQQGNDRGRQYRTGIYYQDAKDLPIIQQVYQYIEKKLGVDKLAVEVDTLHNFVTAEDYHQDYLTNNPGGYCHINMAVREQPLFERKYHKPTDEELKSKLTPLEYKVTQEDATEYAFTSELEEQFDRGLYVSVVTGEPLFLSDDKYDSGCGWPSFTKPILSQKISYDTDYKVGYARTEVRTSLDDGHLGHVFQDGPSDAGGLRYCINGAALRFIKYDDLDDLGYGDYKVLFKPLAEQ